MALAQQDYDQLTTYIKQHIVEWVPQNNPMITFDMQLRERMTKVEESIQHNTERTIRVEEELKHQRELMQQGFDIMDKRFEQVDKRFEEMRQDMDKRFEHVDKRFEEMTKRLDVFMRWSVTTTLAVAGILFAALKLWPPVAG